MPSSTFSSEGSYDQTTAAPSRFFPRAILAWCLLAVILLAALEGATRWGFRRISRNESRTAAEFKEACAIRPNSSDHRPTLLLLGNSLLLEGVDIDALRLKLAPEAKLVRFVVQQTSWLDWYYGIRRLLAEGARPDAIVLCMNAKQLMGDGILGDYSSYYLFNASDIPAIAREVHYDLTKASSLFLARYSMFYAGRQNLRPFLLGRVAPGYGELLHQLQPVSGPLPDSAFVEREAEIRLSQARADAAACGVRFVFLYPPGFQSGEKEVVAAGRRTNTPVMVPIHTGALPESDFRDGFHLNETGRDIFTGALGSALHDLIGTLPRRSR